MKIQLRFTMALLGGSLLFLAGCKKDESSAITITGDYTVSAPTSYGFHNTGYFTTSGAFTTTGNTVMEVHVSGDSANCTATFTAKEGSFNMNMHCSLMNMSGHWNITSATGRYAALRGDGPLTMSFPPDTPTGVAAVEDMTGEVWMH